MRKSILLSFFAGWALAQVQDHSGSVVGTEMWDSSVVHRITADLLVEPGAHLILQQGTIVKLDSGVSVIVAGDLTANGTWSNQVFFTSILDDSQGGDSDGDPYALPAPGDWGSIIFLPGANASGLSGFHEVTVSYGGRTEACLILNCFLEPRSTISFSGSDGIWLNSCGENCDPRLWVRVFDCVGNGLVMNSEGGLILGGAFVGNEMGIVFLHGGPKTKNWPYVAENRSHGLFVDGGLPNFAEVESSYNGGYGFFFNRPIDVNYSFQWLATGNARNFRVPFSCFPSSPYTPYPGEIVEVIGNELTYPLSLAEGVVVHVVEGSARIAPDATLSIPAGSLWKMGPGTGLVVQGSLDAQGTADLPVVFTSAKDDSIGVDLDPTDGFPQAGDWQGISFSGLSQNGSQLAHVLVRFAGQSGRPGLAIDGASVALADVAVDHGLGTGVFLANVTISASGIQAAANGGNGLELAGTTNATLTDCSFFANHSNGVLCSESTQLSLAQSRVFNNTGFGIENRTSFLVFAQENWWGAAGGALGGDGVSGSVDFANPLADGPKFSYFNPGAPAEVFQMDEPSQTGGAVSHEWGSDPEHSILFNDNPRSFQMSFSSLPVPPAEYTLLITYLNEDPGSSSQSLIANGTPIHGPFLLPYKPNTFSFPVPASAVDPSGNLNLHFFAESGTRCVVSEVLLLAQALGVVVKPPVPPTVSNASFVTDPSDHTATAISQNSFLLEGTCAISSSIRLNDTQSIFPNQGIWVAYLDLVQGFNQIKIHARNSFGLDSTPIYVNFLVDSFPPQILACTPSDGQKVNDGNIFIQFLEEGSGLDLNACSLDLRRAGLPMAGSWFISAHELHFQPDTALDDGTYTLAATLRDHSGQTSNSLEVTFELDQTPPEDPTNLVLTVGLDQISASWSPSPNSAGDLAGYRIYLDDALAETVPAVDHQAVLSGLGPGTAYAVRISAIDDIENVSAGILRQTATLTPNPTGLSATPGIASIQLQWDALPQGLSFNQFRVYARTSPFSSVQGLSHAQTTTGTAVLLEGLDIGTTYYVAVATVNAVGLENHAASPVSATPLEDDQAPEITAITFNNVALTDGTVIGISGTLRVTAQDNKRMKSVNFGIDGQPVLTKSGSGPLYTFSFDPVSVADGPHVFTFTAEDQYANVQTESRSVTITLAPPPKPTIATPANGTQFSLATQFVTGTTVANSEVQLYLNGMPQGLWIPVSVGAFSIPVILVEGSNVLEVSARNRGGEGPKSNPSAVVLDTTIPLPPGGLEANSSAGGVIVLLWRDRSEENVRGYNIYRATSPFETPNQATRIHASPLSALTFRDTPTTDGTYYYRLTAVNFAGTESETSEMVYAVSDRVPPRVLTMVYTPEGHYDPTSQRFGTGFVQVEFEVSEPLLTTPFLTMTPDAGSPIPVSLNQRTETEFEGRFEIPDFGGQCTAVALFSARDRSGNRGTQVQQGGSILVDTKAPHLVDILIQPQVPIQNQPGSPVAVILTLTMDEPFPTGSVPEIGFILSETQPDPVPLTVSPQSALDWTVSFTLPSTAGSTPESLQLTYFGSDDLANRSTVIQADNFFEIFQGDLPPLKTPTGFSAQAMPAGAVALSWGDVEGAIGYELYRRGPGDSDFSVLTRVFDSPTHTDQTPLDGSYTYTVASIRQSNALESLSPRSPSRTVDSDSVAPAIPFDLVLNLAGNGIHASWQASGPPEPLTYNLYRTSGTEITLVDGLSPIVAGIPTTQVVDPHPAELEHVYAVTALDQAGNESDPSLSAYLNFELLPVDGFSILWDRIDPPTLSWTHGSQRLAGYHVYRGPLANGVRLNQDLLTLAEFQDFTYDGSARTYSVVAIDDQQAVSPPRSLHLPHVILEWPTDPTLFRGVMNRVPVQVRHLGSQSLSHLVIGLDVLGHHHQSEPFSLSAEETRIVDVVVGGYGPLANGVEATLSLDWQPNVGESVRITENRSFQVQDDLMVVKVVTEDFLRGGTGKVRFEWVNTSPVTVEVVTALHNGKSDSDQIRFNLLDIDGNLISNAAYRQFTGAEVVTLPGGPTVARIAPGAKFLSAPVTLNVPANAPQSLYPQVVIDAFHYRLTQPEHVALTGLQSKNEVPLLETSYTARINSVSPEFSFGSDPIHLTGQALDRMSGQPTAFVPVTLVVSNQGFEHVYQVLSDAAGQFDLAFVPSPKEAGTFEALARHPDLRDTAGQVQFSIYALESKPSRLEIHAPRNYPIDVNLEISSLGGLPAHQVQLNYLANLQPTGQLIEGLQILAPEPLDIQGKTKVRFTFSADNRAPDQGQVYLSLDSFETGTGNGTLIPITFTLSEAAPSIHVHPSFLETGVAQGDTISERVTLENKGLADLDHLRLSLVDRLGNPAPNWLFLSAPAQGIPVGGRLDVDIVFAPGSQVPVSQGVPSEFKLRIEGDRTQEVPIYVFVDNSGQGHALFKVNDLYTGRLDQYQHLIEGLAGAKIKLEKETGTPFQTQLTTDSVGEALASNIPAGRYRYRITADKHEAVAGRLWVRPSVTAQQEVFLNMNLVTVEWSVVPITIEDRYEIVLNATYETNVPAAVLVIEPAMILLPTDMRTGDLFTGEFKLTNYGLVHAKDVVTRLQPPNRHYKIELLTEIPDLITAGQSMRVPYRIQCLEPLSAGDTKEGGGCSGGTGVSVSGNSPCPTGEQASSAGFGALGAIPGCGGGAGGLPGDGIILENNRRGGGYGGDRSGLGNLIGPECGGFDGKKILAGAGAFLLGWAGLDFLTGCDPAWMKAGCWVNLIEGSYYDETFDLAARVPGGPNNIFEYGLDSFLPNPYEITAASMGGFAPWTQAGSTESSGALADLSGQGLQPTAFGDSFSSQAYVGVPEIDPFDEIGLPGPGTFDNPFKAFDGATNPGVTGKNNLLAIKRIFLGDRWQWEHERNRIDILTDPVGEQRGVVLAGINYLDPQYPGNTATHKTFIGIQSAISYDPAVGYRWQNVYGSWMTFDLEGRLSAFGTLGNILIAELVYPTGAGTRVSEIRDRSGRVVYRFEYQDGELSAIEDYDQRRVEYTWNAQGKLADVRNVLGQFQRYQYDGNGRMTRSTHFDEGFDLIQYDTFSRVKSVVNETGTGYAFDYLKDEFRGENYASVLSSSGTLEEYWFARNRQLLRKDVNGINAVKLAYGTRHQVSQEPNGNQTRLDFSDRGYLTTVTFADNTSLRYTYDGPFPTSYTDVLGKRSEYTFQGYLLRELVEGKGLAQERKVTFAYDGLGQMTSYTFMEDDPADHATFTIDYDAIGNITAITDPMGAVSRFLSHNWHGNPYEYQDAAGHLWTTEYDLYGRVTAQTDPLGLSYRYEFDAGSNITAVVDETGARFEMEYDQNDNLVLIRDPLGHETRNEFNAANLLTRTTDPEGHSLSYGYDLFDRIKQISDGLGNSIQVDYNPLDVFSFAPAAIRYPTFEQRFHYNSFYDVTRITDVAAGIPNLVTHYGYDQAQRLITETDAEGNISHYAYDILNRMDRVTDPMEQEEAYDYGKWNELDAFHDANGRTYASSFDKAGRLTEETRPLGQQTHFEYDDLDRVTGVIDPKGQKQGYVYDEVGNVIEIRLFAAGDHDTPVKVLAFQYDGRGLLTYASDGEITCTFSYDSLQRLLVESIDYGPFVLNHAYTWYANGAKESYTDPEGNVYVYRYDANDELAQLDVPGLGTIEWDQYHAGQPTRVRYPGGVELNTTLNHYWEILGIDARDGLGANLFAETYRRSPAGNVVERTGVHGTTLLDYDPLHRLTSAQNQPTGDETYSYDAAGNRLSSADEPGTWQYDDNNALVGKGDYTFDYDENGNRILRQLGGELIHYHYDVLNQLTRIEDQNGQVLAEYGYDLFGRRIWKQVDGVRTWFYYTDEGLAAELDGSGAVTRSYGFHPHSFGSSNPLFVKQGEQYYWILNDASGFPVRVVQPDGGVVWAGQHDSFGEVTVDYEALHYPFRFPGQYYDQESDLYYNWHRYYDPDTGRYLSWDPAEDGSNHYLYVENNPTIYVDPDGQKLIWWAFTTFTPQGKALKYAAKFLKAAKKVPGAKKLVNKARKAMRRAGKTGCFVAGTLVQTSEGLLPIEDILVGDLVWSMDSNTGIPGLASVSRIIRSQTVRVIDVRLDDQTLIQTTPEHPFWVLDEGWKEAAEIVPGSRLLRKGSGTPAVISINEKPAIADVYNLEVKGPHAYFVTEGEILVHNADCSGGNGRGYSTGGGKNAQHANRNAREAAKERYEKAKEEYERLKSTPNKSKETKNEMEKAKRTMDKARKDKDFTGENHSKKGKGCR